MQQAAAGAQPVRRTPGQAGTSGLRETHAVIAGVRTRMLRLSGASPTFVLLHGFADSADTWRPLLAELGRRGHAAVAVDMPGFGSADRLEANSPVLPQLDAFTDSLLLRVRRPAVLVGNSLGGCVAMRAAERDAGRLAGVVAIAPAGLDMSLWVSMIGGAPPLRALLAQPVPLRGALVRTVVAVLYRRLAFAHPERLDPGVIERFTSHLDDTRTIARLLRTGESLRVELRNPFCLPRVRCPVLLVWGTRDRLVFSSGARRVLLTLPGSRMELIEDCGHCPQIEATDRLAGLLSRFARPRGRGRPRARPAGEST